MAQVKFYSKASLPTGADIDENGVYFINGGELYKGSQRFGLGKVTIAQSTTGISGMERGDIVVTGSGAGWVYAGSEAEKGWQSIGGDIGSLQSMWQADIKAGTSGLAKGGAGSYITGITQSADGKVTAQASNFANDVKTAVGNSTSTSTNNGVTVSVTTTSGVVTSVEVTAPAAKTWTAIDVGDANSYIYNVQQAEDGQVSALAKAFPTLGTGTSDGTVKLDTGADAKVSGWDTVKTDITNLQAVVSYSGTGTKAVTADTVTATTGNFTNLNVTDTATFSATEVSAGSLTIDDIPVDNVAASSATGSNSGVAVTVSTANGGVKQVGVAVTKADLNTALGTTNVADKTIATSIRASGTAVDTALATEKAVRDALNAFDNAMHFKGVVKELPATGDAGDIVVIGANPTGDDPTGKKLVAGQEYIYADNKWEKIGDQSAVTGGTSTSTVNNVSVQVVTAAATAAPTVTLTGIGTAAQKEFATAVTANADTLPTGGAVATYVTDITNLKASVGTGNAAGGFGISGQVVLASDAQPTLTITVSGASTKAEVSAEGKAGQVVTAGAVNGFVVDSITSAMSYTSGASVYIGVTTVPGALNAAGAAIDTLKTSVSALKTKTDAYVGGTSTGSWTEPGVSVAAISTTVGIDTSTMAPTVTMNVNVAELKHALGLGDAASMGVTTSLSGATDVLPTDAAVKTYVDTALAWITDPEPEQQP